MILITDIKCIKLRNHYQTNYYFIVFRYAHQAKPNDPNKKRKDLQKRIEINDIQNKTLKMKRKPCIPLETLAPRNKPNYLPSNLNTLYSQELVFNLYKNLNI